MFAKFFSTTPASTAPVAAPLLAETEARFDAVEQDGFAGRPEIDWSFGRSGLQLDGMHRDSQGLSWGSC